MSLTDIQKFEDLFKSATALGSARILREYLQQPANFPLPLSIAHGVDFNHTVRPMDIDLPEPIHWSFNQDIHTRATSIKASVRIPHPWTILKQKIVTQASKQTLIIGPPPGRSNDHQYLNLLEKAGITTGDLLLKFRGELTESTKFWTTRGYRVVSAGPQDSGFYDRLFALICDYDTLISGTLSSALIFGASVGKTCNVLKGYRYSVYDHQDYRSYALLKSREARQFIELFINERKAEYIKLATRILGEELISSPAEINAQLLSTIESLRAPVHFGARMGVVERGIALFSARLTGRAGLVKGGVRSYMRKAVSPKVVKITIDEIDVLLNGLSSDNFSIETIPYIKGVTEPGWGVD